MSKNGLDELIGIWERWTNADPLLRQALDSDGSGTPDHTVLVQMATRLNAMSSGPARRESATTAAVLAGWAVLLAIEGEDEASDGQWRRMLCDALEAHKRALEERAESG
jgi:hypothetical protein